ncbi:hypothetical protein Tco_0745346 [Tanacetum coccineum]
MVSFDLQMEGWVSMEKNFPVRSCTVWMKLLDIVLKNWKIVSPSSQRTAMIENGDFEPQVTHTSSTSLIGAGVVTTNAFILIHHFGFITDSHLDSPSYPREKRLYCCDMKIGQVKN